MKGGEHAAVAMLTAGGLVAGVGALRGLPFETVSLLAPMLVAAAGSLAPDLDHPQSIGGGSIPASLIALSGVFLLFASLPKRLGPPWTAMDISGFGPGPIRIAWLALWLSVAVVVLSVLACRLSKHRGPLHSLGFGAIASLAVLILLAALRAPVWLSLMFALGWLTHLATDAPSKTGLPCLLWPVVKPSSNLRSRV